MKMMKMHKIKMKMMKMHKIKMMTIKMDRTRRLATCLSFMVSLTCALGQSTGSAPVSGKPSCESLAGLALPNAKISAAQSVAAGAFVGPPAPFSGEDLSAFYKKLPAFCRFAVDATPTADSEIKIEVWLPASGWNGKLQGIGNGGFAGEIDFPELGSALSHGYAAVATDTGHSGNFTQAEWAMGHPEKVIDFGHRGIHEMTRVAKAAVRAFYGKAPQHSYFAGCSDGGREALMEAQRYPEDYDGILAGAPANYWTRLLSTAVVDTQALTLDPASFIPPAKISVISAGVLAACDEIDGVQDGILNDPRQCHFDPASIECKAGEGSDRCLTGPQAAALKKLYAGPHDAQMHEVFPGFLPGAEGGQDGWEVWITGPAPNKSLIALFGLGYFSNMVYGRHDWNYKTFTLEAGLKAAEEKTASALNATDPDLKPFQLRGGKLILYHGWNDPAIPALNTINYFESVIAKMRQKSVDSFVRLYMAPGVQHCGDGPGPDSFGQVGDWAQIDPQHSAYASLQQWVEKGVAPTEIIATKYASNDPGHRVQMTRPLCAYPLAAKYKGVGNTNDAANFVCGAEKK
jgi:feruloyl esterase